MPYEFDLFLSYQRSGRWPKFVTNIFQPMLDHWLHTELGEKPRMFLDATTIETGTSWPRKLADGIASSRLLLCLWSRGYFASDWCLAELSHMMARRKAASGTAAPLPLIIGVVIHDGQAIPMQLSDIQCFPIQQYANPWMCEGSAMAEELSGEIRTLASHIAEALGQVPDHNPEWQSLASDEFRRVFTRRQVQNQPPSLGVTE